ncbi:uncharacterized protein CEXT_249431 [Caerostris extrusa]|uniref:Uncharacterized protein n=1 Tax=Caerostris extrusa TaxID=172846 RepID=A0AAV4QJY2_CAEEX|nr:uncharacterized protein CEXT_249431 [Caerostris extrusa]
MPFDSPLSLLALFNRIKIGKQNNKKGYQVSEAKGPPYGSSMYSRDKYHDTINGEALRSPLNDVEETFHEDILMKEIMKQEAEPSKSSKIEPKVPPNVTYIYLFMASHTFSITIAVETCKAKIDFISQELIKIIKDGQAQQKIAAQNILKNGHNYVKDGCNSTTSEIDINTTDINRSSLLNERVPADPTMFIPPSPPNRRRSLA